MAVVALVAGGALTGAALYRYLRVWQRQHESAHEPDAHATPKPALHAWRALQALQALQAWHAWLAPGPSGAAADLGGRF